jgi:hypothetical protein
MNIIFGFIVAVQTPYFYLRGKDLCDSREDKLFSVRRLFLFSLTDISFDDGESENCYESECDRWINYRGKFENICQPSDFGS